jgi:hypothetical protein
MRATCNALGNVTIVSRQLNNPGIKSKMVDSWSGDEERWSIIVSKPKICLYQMRMACDALETVTTVFIGLDNPRIKSGIVNSGAGLEERWSPKVSKLKSYIECT